MSNWEHKAKEDAIDILRDNMEDLVDCVENNSGVVMERDLERCVEWYDKVFEWLSSTDISPREATEILEELHQFQETDSGLWQGQEPLEAVSAMGFWTYKNAVQHFINVSLKDIASIDFDVARKENEDEDEEFNRDEIEQLIDGEL